MALKLLTRLVGRSLAGSPAASAQRVAAASAGSTASVAAEPLQLLASWPSSLLGGGSGGSGNPLNPHQQQLCSISEITGKATGSTTLQAANYGVAARQVHNDIDTYHVSVVTGNVRGAGTNSAAFLQLVGSHGESEKVVIGNSHEEGLQRGSKVTFEVQVPQGIGPLRRVFIEREKSSCTDTGEGWYLEAVVVHGPSGEHYLFPCNSWFGHSDCGDYEGALERNLAPMVAADVEPVKLPRAVSVAVSGVAFPHPEKVIKNKIRGVNMKGFGYGGEDAYFYASAQSIVGMGVADGVYMWKELGIDSGTMARTLMETCQHMVAAGCEDVYKILATAARHVESEGVQGSCTACLLTINKDTGRLQAATLGDSGFLIVGPKSLQHGELQLTVKFRTAQLEHEFGCPYQLGHHRYANSPCDADLAALPVSPGDVIIMGSDGLLDNMSETEVVNEVSKLVASGLRPAAMAQQIAKVAFDNSVDKHRVTPYSRAATEAFDMVYSGGKPDDITVLVAVIS